MTSILTLILSSSLALGAVTTPADSIPTAFFKPTDTARPLVWWHWMDGEVSLEGIKADLEWMHRSGIAGFHQFDAGGVNMPKAAKVKRPYLSEGWKEAFGYAIRLADSLGMEISIASAPGWSSTGGPWVKPEDAMKKLEWRSKDVSGGRVDVLLPPLYNNLGPYQDIRKAPERGVVIKPWCQDIVQVAVRLDPADRSMEELGAVLQKSDGEIVCRFPRRTLVKAFTLRTGYAQHRERSGSLARYKNVLEVSDDGKKWREVMKITPSQLQYETINIRPVSARFFRVRGEKLMDLALHTVNKLELVQEKGGFCFPYDFGSSITPNASGASTIVLPAGSMDAEGRLRCDLPAGRWRIYRFGASLTGKVNHPASLDATGLEVDKLDPEAWKRYFRTYFDMYRDAAGGLLGRKGIRYVLTDSYEAGTETWTRRLPEEFEARRGYSLLPWLPVLAGEIVESSSRSEAFLWDWRKTLSELFTENYDRINALCAEYGMAGRYTESHESGRAFVGDGMDIKRSAAFPMSAIWMQGPSGSSLPSAISDIKESASVSHLYGQNITAAESFTVNGEKGNAYRNHPANLKYTADIAMWAGVNRFVIHDSASQPSDDYLPGLGLFKYGQWFHRNDTWAPYARVWTDYLARSCQLLSLGRYAADILLFYGEDTNATAQYGGEKMDYLPQIPDGYAYDYASPDVLLNVVKPSGGRLVSGSGMSYAVLMLGNGCFRMSEGMLRRIKEFADAGIIICGSAPKYQGGLADDAAAWKALVKDIFASGRKNVLTSLPDALALACPAPDIECISGLEKVRYVHRRLEGGTEIYWIRNFSGDKLYTTFSFREGSSNAAIFDPRAVSAERVASSVENGRTSVPVRMKADDAIFVVLTPVPLALPEQDRLITLYKRESGMRWDVYFDQKGGEKAVETFNNYPSWTENSDPVVKYYSGTASYRTNITFEPYELAAECVQLDLGDVREIAEVFINGHSAGVLWSAPFITDNIRGMIREGENQLEIKVTNLWVNRMIGDRMKGMTTVTKVRRFYTADDPLMPSGLLGPVRVVTSRYEKK